MEPLFTMLTILTLTGRNRHGQRLCKATCACGNEFECLHNNARIGRTKTCGHCGKPAKEVAPKPAPVPAPAPPPEVTSTFEYGSPAWYDEQIAGKKAAALSAEKRCNDLEEELASAKTTDLDTHKRWNAEATTARKLRQEIARLQKAKDSAETGTKKDTRTAAEITRDKIAALRGSK